MGSFRHHLFFNSLMNSPTVYENQTGNFLNKFPSATAECSHKDHMVHFCTTSSLLLKAQKCHKGKSQRCMLHSVVSFGQFHYMSLEYSSPTCIGHIKPLSAFCSILDQHISALPSAPYLNVKVSTLSQHFRINYMNVFL